MTDLYLIYQISLNKIRFVLNFLKEIGITASNPWIRIDFRGDKNIYRVDSDENTNEPILKKSIY